MLLLGLWWAVVQSGLLQGTPLPRRRCRDRLDHFAGLMQRKLLDPTYTTAIMLGHTSKNLEG